MFEQLIIKYCHRVYNIGLQDIRNGWLLEKSPVKLATGVILFSGCPGPVNASATGYLKKG